MRFLRWLRKPGVCVCLILCLTLAGLFSWRRHHQNREKAVIIELYGAFKEALASGDDTAIQSFLAPSSYLKKGRTRNLGWIRGAAPYTSKSDVKIRGDRAWVIPHRIHHRVFGVVIIPGGDAVRLVKVQGNWKFTGGISID